MQVTETFNEGLKREIRVVVPAGDLEARLVGRLADVQGKIRLKGFRPGRIPAAHLRKMYGKSCMAEVINEIMNDVPHSVLAEREERSATQPKISINNEDEEEAQKVLDGKADLVFIINYEVLPRIEIGDVSAIEVIREIADISEKEIDEQVERVLSSARTYTEKKGKAEPGDQVTIDYLGRIDGKPFEGGENKDARLILGEKKFIPGFEEQLAGVSAGDNIQITVTFPAEYSAEHLAGKEAVFDIRVKEIASPDAVKIDDETAKKLGLESLSRLREVVREQVESQYASVTRQKVKRQILDALDKDYQFEIPEQLVEVEFNNIWNQINLDLQQAGRTFEDEDMTEEDARGEYRRLAERRVRLGLVLSGIGEKAGVSVSDEELQRVIYAQVKQYPGREKEIFDFFRRTPDAVANLRAPIYEEKIIDHLLEKIKVIDKKVTPEELTAEDIEGNPPSEKGSGKKKARGEGKNTQADKA